MKRNGSSLPGMAEQCMFTCVTEQLLPAQRMSLLGRQNILLECCCINQWFHCPSCCKFQEYHSNTKTNPFVRSLAGKLHFSSFHLLTTEIPKHKKSQGQGCPKMKRCSQKARGNCRENYSTWPPPLLIVIYRLISRLIAHCVVSVLRIISFSGCFQLIYLLDQHICHSQRRHDSIIVWAISQLKSPV